MNMYSVFPKYYANNNLISYSDIAPILISFYKIFQFKKILFLFGNF